MPNLVGIGLSQVPTNSMLGGLAYQDPEHASIKDLDLKNLSQINSEITDTAVDIFIYDTSKDSDGGAWRKRTTHTSWYNETLGTATRGTRREFPAVAVIVLESTRVTIYDGDDPDLPMWIVFDRASSAGWTPNNTNILGVSYSTFTSISMLNGIFAMGADYASDDNNGVLIKVSFVEDTGYFHGVKSVDASYPAGGFGRYRGSIAERDSGKGHFNINDTDKINNAHVYSVAMHVQPNAPIDTATGLPVPTIAVGGNYHMTVIRGDGATADYQGFNPTQLVEICSGSVFGTAVPGNGYDYIYKTDIKRLDGTYNTEIVAGGTNYFLNSSSTGTIPQLRYMGIDDFVIDPVEKTAYRAGSAGLDIIRTGRTVTTTHAILPVAYIASDYNTGYMVGDIKGAFLSETTTGNLSTTNLNLITNGDFSNGTNGWSNDSTPTFTVSGGGVASVDRNGGGATGQCYQTITTEVGRTYTVGVLVSALSHGFQVYAGEAPSASNITMNGGAINSTGTHYWTFTATTTTTRLDFSATQNVNGTASFDNITIFDGVADRSAKRKGFGVRGTVAKSAVATGAELVSYGPFNNNNNFRQPYNSDLNFEQNDFSIMFWVYDTGVDQHCTLISRDEREFDISRLANAYGNKLRIYTRNSSETLRAPDSASALPQNKWVCVCVVYTGGNTKKVYLDGVLDNTITGTNGEYDIDSTSYGMTIGARTTNGVYNYSSAGIKLALMRISGSAPSTEQVKKMYEDEKHLFQENAACTLYGSSDAVTALAYDEDTERLHVGTSAGRSDFQGLRRINNTTTAVTTAISAHDGFIVEQ